MKTNRYPTTMITGTLAISILITGIISDVSASEHKGYRSNNQQRHEQQVSREQNNRDHRYQRNNNSPQKVYYVSTPSRKTVHSLPHGYRSIRHNNQRYYYHHGIFYNRYNNGYVIVEKPRFYHLPQHARRVVVNRIPYFVCDNTYYQSCGDYYEICEAPVVICETPRPRSHTSSSISINAGPLTVVLSNHY